METLLIETATHGRALLRRGGPRCLIGFHGYGENAATHMRELERIPAIGDWTLVAVQGLHRFYARNEQVVASWMTSEDREAAIADNVTYVRRVVEIVSPVQILAFAGFSQGVAMAWRAAAAIGCDALVILGGDIPPDLVEEKPFPPILLGRGQSDSWYDEEKFKKDLSFLARHPVEPFVFEGGHEWSDSFREAAGKFLSGIAGRRATSSP
jgi:predicted esterase